MNPHRPDGKLDAIPRTAGSIRGSGPGQPLRSPRVGDVQRAVVARIVQVVVDRNRHRGKTLSVVMRLHLKKCGKTWRMVESRWKRRRGRHGRVARAVVGDRDAHAALELAVRADEGPRSPARRCADEGASNGHRRGLGNHDVVGKVDAGDLEHALPTR